MPTRHVDILIVGAGLSGIAAAYYLQRRNPNKRYCILEGRNTLGGTWDLFRYPGIRSDSDMHTLGYSFRPWRETRAIVGGPAILNYLRETAAAYGIDRHICFGHRVQRATWSSAGNRWTVEAICEPDGEIARFSCNFLYMCSGYYAYDHGYTPAWPGVERFAGRIVHPQHWPDDLEYAGKRMLVIGSGATAVTLVPAMAATAAHVVMLQRSPTYVVSGPSEDTAANWLHQRLPARIAAPLARWRSLLFGLYFYIVARRRPASTRRAILDMAQQQLGPDYDVATHFAPHYQPWDQRLCLAPDGDLFAAIRAGKASVVTDRIDTFTETGVRLHSGQEIQADIIVTATGLVMRMFGNVQLAVDGVPVDPAQTLCYKGAMYSDIPNFASIFGYTNASWTLKCELIAEYVCRLLNYMDRRGYARCTPRQRDPAVRPMPLFDFTSGYVQRARAVLPQQGSKAPWRLYQNYLRDLLSLRISPLNDGVLEFARPGE